MTEFDRRRLFKRGTTVMELRRWDDLAKTAGAPTRTLDELHDVILAP